MTQSGQQNVYKWFKCQSDQTLSAFNPFNRWLMRNSISWPPQNEKQNQTFVGILINTHMIGSSIIVAIIILIIIIIHSQRWTFNTINGLIIHDIHVNISHCLKWVKQFSKGEKRHKIIILTTNSKKKKWHAVAVKVITVNREWTNPETGLWRKHEGYEAIEMWKSGLSKSNGLRGGFGSFTALCNSLKSPVPIFMGIPIIMHSDTPGKRETEREREDSLGAVQNQVLRVNSVTIKAPCDVNNAAPSVSK